MGGGLICILHRCLQAGSHYWIQSRERNFTRGVDRSTEGASVVLVTNKVTMATKK